MIDRNKKLSFLVWMVVNFYLIIRLIRIIVVGTVKLLMERYVTTSHVKCKNFPFRPNTCFVPSYPFLHVSFRSLSIGELCTLVTDTLDFVPRPWGSRGIGGNFHQTGECKSMELVVEEARFKWDWRFNWTVDKVCLGS